MVETERLILRPFRDDDLAAYAAIMADPEVAGPLGGVLTPGEAQARMARNMAESSRSGLGRFALVRRSEGDLIGYCGFMPIADELPLGPGLEIGWGLARHAWGQGFATEAAIAAIAHAFARTDAAELFGFTTETNRRSQAVMARAGFARRPELDFDHPNVPAGSPLRRHLVFSRRP